MPRMSDDILARVAAWPEDQEGFAGNFWRDMARELIAARLRIAAADRLALAVHSLGGAELYDLVGIHEGTERTEVEAALRAYDDEAIK